MSSDADVLSQIGFDFIIKVVRIAVEAVCYGIYLLLISFSTNILFRKGWRSTPVLLLLLATLIMFTASSIFFAMDIADIVQRFQIVLIRNPDQPLQEKQDQANGKVQNLVWIGEMLFIFMLVLGDSIVVWRTWALYYGNRRLLIVPLLTWTGSLVAAFYELGCDVHNGWALPSSDPSAGSVGAESCAKADTISFSLSYATNIICTSLIFFKAWQHRQSMIRFLGTAARGTQVQKIMTLLVESGMMYIALYTFQAVPIYGGSFSSGSLIVVEAVNAIVQQAMGMYPTAIVVLVEMQKSLWDTTEVSRNVSEMRFASRTAHTRQTDPNSEHTARHTTINGSLSGKTDKQVEVVSTQEV